MILSTFSIYTEDYNWLFLLLKMEQLELFCDSEILISLFLNNWLLWLLKKMLSLLSLIILFLFLIVIDWFIYVYSIFKFSSLPILLSFINQSLLLWVRLIDFALNY